MTPCIGIVALFPRVGFRGFRASDLGQRHGFTTIPKELFHRFGPVATL
ncbi:hypothetical protein CCP2SC5_140050 [Azospirillaceae bacterium]